MPKDSKGEFNTVRDFTPHGSGTAATSDFTGHHPRPGAPLGSATGEKRDLCDGTAEECDFLGCKSVIEAAEEVRITSPTGGQKGIKLARFDLIPPTVLRELAEHYGKGAKKYGDSNWRKGYDWKLSYRSVHDHLNAFWSGEDFDEETGSKHVIAAAWHCIALAWYMDDMPEYDSRPGE
jgi:hypothetical protein